MKRQPRYILGGVLIELFTELQTRGMTPPWHVLEDYAGGPDLVHSITPDPEVPDLLNVVVQHELGELQLSIPADLVDRLPTWTEETAEDEVLDYIACLIGKKTSKAFQAAIAELSADADLISRLANMAPDGAPTLTPSAIRSLLKDIARGQGFVSGPCIQRTE